MSAAPLLEVKGLGICARAHGGQIRVLDGISLALARRDALGVIGRSGSGKSVLAKALIGWIDEPLVRDAGIVRFAGTDLYAADSRALRSIRGRRISYVGADPTTIFDPTVPVGAQIAEKLRAVKPDVSPKAALDRVHELFDLVRIPEARQRMHELPSKFSGGMIQRAAIVDAVIADAELLIADNVTQPLDVTVAAQIIRLFQDLRQRLDTAFLFISSSLPVVKEFADQLVVLDEGRIVERSTPERLAARPESAQAKRLVAQIPRIWGSGAAPPAPDKQGERDAEPVLSVQNAVKTYAVHRKGALFAKLDVQAVRGVTFDVRRGESLAIVGESGCGKSTLLRLLTWLEMPDAGEIRFAGRGVRTMSAAERFSLRSQLQLVLQDPYGSIPAHWTVGRTISESLRLHGGLGASDRRERVIAIMREVGLDPRLYQKLPGGLSAGQRQRINLARALVLEPTMLLLDETLSALDPSEQAKLIELFERLQLTRGITYIFISHDLAMVRRVCSRVAVMYLGRIVEIAGNARLFDDPQHPYTRALLSAVPTLEPSPFSRDACLFEGEPPSPVRLPRGCSFANRCPMTQTVCREDDPPMRPLLDGTAAACHFAGSIRIVKTEGGAGRVG
ncbi:MAG: ABC transporter ATP-binding protein [Burkholderiaceae bacterium]